MGNSAIYLDDEPFCRAVEAMLVACRMTTDAQGLKTFTRADPEAAQEALFNFAAQQIGRPVALRSSAPEEMI